MYIFIINNSAVTLGCCLSSTDQYDKLFKVYIHTYPSCVGRQVYIYDIICTLYAHCHYKMKFERGNDSRARYFLNKKSPFINIMYLSDSFMGNSHIKIYFYIFIINIYNIFVKKLYFHSVFTQKML